MSLPKYWDMQQHGDERYGRVLCEEEFLAYFGCIPSPTETDCLRRLVVEHEPPRCTKPALT